MSGARWRAVLLPVRAVVSPDASLREAAVASGRVMAASLLLLVALLGALALPRLQALLGAGLADGRSSLLDAHVAVLRVGLARYVLADRLLPPLPYAIGAVFAWLVSAPVLAGSGVRARTVAAVLMAGASPLLVQRAGELAVVWLTPGGALAAGDIVGLPARFNVGVAGALAAAGVRLDGWRSVAAEAANGIGVWVVLLWGWGLACLDRGPRATAPRASGAIRWCLVAAVAYGAGYAMYGALLPAFLVLVMGAP